MEVILLEVGKTYENRGKTEIVKIIEYDEKQPIYRHKGDNDKTYGPTGTWMESMGETRHDLVREVQPLNTNQ